MSRKGKTIVIQRSMVAWDWCVEAYIDCKHTEGNFWGDGNVLKLDWGDACTAVQIHLNSCNNTLKMDNTCQGLKFFHLNGMHIFSFL